MQFTRSPTIRQQRKASRQRLPCQQRAAAGPAAITTLIRAGHNKDNINNWQLIMSANCCKDSTALAVQAVLRHKAGLAAVVLAGGQRHKVPLPDIIGGAMPCIRGKDIAGVVSS